MITLRYGFVLSTMIGLLLSGSSGCAAPQDGDGEDREALGDDKSAIVGGVVAHDYPEAVLVNMIRDGRMAAACSGAMIAPSVVLTAGHCVHGFDRWQVVAPFADGQTATGWQAVTEDWTNETEHVDPTMHDVGLILLDSTIELDQYPAVADDRVEFGSKVVEVGRIKSGALSNEALFASRAHPVGDGARFGFPYSYVAREVIQSGDSGGPDFIPGSYPHTIVAVNSGGGGGAEVLARVDLVHDWIMSTMEKASAPPPGKDAPPGKEDPPDSDWDDLWF